MASTPPWLLIAFVMEMVVSESAFGWHREVLQRLQRKAPVNQAVVDAIHDAETRQQGSPHLTAAALWQHIQSN